MDETPFDKLIKVIDYKIKDHQNYIDEMNLKEEALRKQVAKGVEDLKNHREEAAVVTKELILSKDKIIFHKGAISSLNDMRKIIEEANKQLKKLQS